MKAGNTIIVRLDMLPICSSSFTATFINLEKMVICSTTTCGQFV